jgi:lipid-binding SYLF domain-containing protein
MIPPHILSNAKGLAIFTVLKAGFLFSGRAGSGLVVARYETIILHTLIKSNSLSKKIG